MREAPADVRDLASSLAWLERHWTGRIPPTRIHGRGVEPESALGSPELADSFRRYLDQRPGDVITERVSETCYHPRLPGNERPTACPDCDGLGVREADRANYRDPMWKAVQALAAEDMRQLGPSGYAQVIIAIVASGYHPVSAARLIGAAVNANAFLWSRRDFWEPVFVLAIRKLYTYYLKAPMPLVAKPSWVDLSESQRNAIENGGDKAA